MTERSALLALGREIYTRRSLIDPNAAIWYASLLALDDISLRIELERVRYVRPTAASVPDQIDQMVAEIDRMQKRMTHAE